MEYILVTDAQYMNSLASLRHLADKNRLAQSTIRLKQKDTVPDATGFYVSMYSSNGIHASLSQCAEQIYIQSVSGEWFPVKQTSYPNISKLIGGLFDGQLIDPEFQLETQQRLNLLHSRVVAMQEDPEQIELHEE